MYQQPYSIMWLSNKVNNSINFFVSVSRDLLKYLLQWICGWNCSGSTIFYYFLWISLWKWKGYCDKVKTVFTVKCRTQAELCLHSTKLISSEIFAMFVFEILAKYSSLLANKQCEQQLGGKCFSLTTDKLQIFTYHKISILWFSFLWSHIMNFYFFILKLYTNPSKHIAALKKNDVLESKS